MHCEEGADHLFFLFLLVVKTQHNFSNVFNFEKHLKLNQFGNEETL